MNSASTSLLLSLSLAIVSPMEVHGEEFTIVVSAGEIDRDQTPLAVELPVESEHQRVASLIDIETGTPVAAQISDSANPEVSWVLQRPLAAHSKRTYKLALEEDRDSSARSNVKCILKDGHLVVKSNDLPVLQYNVAINRGPKGTESSQARNAYIHPLFSPDGQVVTDDFAPDHVHQRGLFFAWTKTRIGDRELNFWEVQQNTGRIVHTDLKDVRDGTVFAQFKAEHEFVDLHDSSMPVPVLKELWTVRVYNVDEGFLIDLISDQTCVADHPLTIGPYHYGGMAIRGRREWITPTNGNSFSMLTSAGLDRKEGNHSRPQWVDFGGRLNGKPVGLVALCHPNNFRFPQTVRLHPTKPYFCFAPLVSESFQIEPGQVYRSRYRFFVYAGDKNPQRAKRFWADYSDPPQTEVMPTRQNTSDR